jgi:uncharacterized protein (DUF362 family)/NAD-dependent dihydropyrimidine dehydrogenase PreA subunit
MAHFVKPGQKILIKPNCLMGSSPEAAVTTHPSVISAVVKEVIRAGAAALVGDSPGNAYTNIAKTMEETGIKKAVEEAGGKMIYFQQEGVVEVKSPSNKTIPIARVIFEVDAIINLPKLKTHNLTLFTGAIKNMFGLVPGFNKAQFHLRFPKPRDFAEALVDIFEIAKPRLTIMDAVVGMEGPGPANGTPRKLGALLASTDSVAVDAVSSHLIGYDPFQIDTTVIAARRKLGEGRLENIETPGADIKDLRQADWKHPFNINFLTNRLPEFVYRLLSPIVNRVRVDPLIDQKKCTRCLVCVKNCPAKTILTRPLTPSLPAGRQGLYKRGGTKGGEFKVEIDLRNCIHCFCCHELCRYDAVKLQRSWLARRLGIPV